MFLRPCQQTCLITQTQNLMMIFRGNFRVSDVSPLMTAAVYFYPVSIDIVLVLRLECSYCTSGAAACTLIKYA